MHYWVPKSYCPECVIPNLFNLDGTPQHLGFVSESRLQAHIRKEHNVCPFCDLKVGSKQSLDHHVESQHSGKPLEERKNILCTVSGCESTFTKKANLEAHIKSSHIKELWVCGASVFSAPDLTSWDNSDGCGKEYTTKATLENHIRIAHLGLPDKANASRRKNDLEKPKKIGGTKPYKPSEIDEILGTAYENDPRRTICCIYPDCSKKFMREFDLQKHLRSKSGHCLATPEVDELPRNVPPVARRIRKKKDNDNAIKIVNEATPDDMRDQQGSLVGDGVVDPRLFIAEELDFNPEDGQFWIGAEDNGLVNGNEEFSLDLEEMRRLIDEGEYPQFVDGGLGGL
jgi:general transcription factor IIIA